jgi:TonB-dependent SusC/RagA subfamily outer membrane receptor
MDTLQPPTAVHETCSRTRHNATHVFVEDPMNRFRGELAVALAVACGGTTSRPPDTATTNTGAVTTVVPTETDARVSRVEELLRGVAGLEVTPLPNGTYRLRIRGQRSIRGNPGDDEPLLVIDDIPVSGGSMSTALAGLAPRDVARIEVLKDAAATSVYGSRGANGVIVIMTKRAP